MREFVAVLVRPCEDGIDFANKEVEFINVKDKYRRQMSKTNIKDKYRRNFAVKCCR